MAFFTPWKLSSQKLGFFLVTFGFIWGMMLLHFTIQQKTQHESSSVLREQILDLSKRYIKALAEENRNVVDGPYVGTMTAYDLKKTLAVLLDNILQRIGKLESKVENLVINGTGANSTNSTATATPSSGIAEKLNVADLINGAQEQCELPPMDGFPHCEGKIKWMKDMWRSDPCYASYGVDGSTCSFFIYLSEVENWCPRLPWRSKNPNEETDQKTMAEIRTNFDMLYKMMSRHEEFRWMMLRIRRMADTWIEAIKSLAEKQHLEKRKRKKVLVHLGLLTKESGFKIAENAFSGGPLGELVQWSDLITSLYLLGHDIRISASLAELKEIMKKVVGNRSGCPTQGDKVVQLIYIDIVGLTQFKKTLGPSWVHYQCMLRVLDSFGTEPEFNHAHYAQSKGHKTPWGKWNLNPQQFYTMFPHTPDNSFLGFVVEQYLNSSDIKHFNVIKRQNQSLVYGKVDNFWKDKKSYLDVIHTYTEVHGTVHGTSTIYMPNYVKNHGILSGRDLQFLLRGTKLFVGLGFPYEGPAPLEAIANGCAFLNPKFNPPKSSKNTDFFKGKPTLRELTSQHPYAEVYIGRPHVWTVNINDLSEVEKAVKAILSQKIEPYLPFEFTCEGMLQRMNVFIEKQDFCHGQVMWPPLSALQVKIAAPGKSCKQVCQENQLICEPSFFQHLNKDKDLLKYNIECHTVESANDILVPSFDERRKHCVFQGDLLLFSCAGSHPNHKRICPCRDYIKGQVALCKDCL
ncbi:alpha-1,6-mannosylglycoprotein 6-beta-N-acetylglucosaminyltransferase A [Varanus komodoensis]|uniref:alpha-1,6-mannosyl-glycoprotein 6-beta-N-acetylglucosaminyltransferase n=1 Tax=Varanus komodoensis TaxID=61221 RepID=A0A8D2IVT1_VARKO|nr:alpha-1,6-mannosylglycoprotein 6-beta-N-acetylglucosaminyltransferase A [Varanus komodoensis]XP_044294116.1 alpha-1,6-mannosylglycoprotein 6-beta-N-acetylglucosaminyltransferase A [Varanus komodoensis]XP_044294117.1 alpha-1,6-mannosylglycoprotein 6-beta-N-acetylglucosaminyltransferase A [Varanus komodoensis]XP_044294118.1 alpha-1,6-mannosylglycoprotein 6-beta-N-acetylglucosaminyltransferase A [Varanus komodoensis]XP_044294119.1 alpha-1,6-mannosylglycoprotein 6-beta-N-acetylglucosaminyltransf